MSDNLETQNESAQPAEPPSRFDLWAGWAALTTAGWIIGFAPGFGLAVLLGLALPAGNPLIESVVAPTAGLTAGVLQGVLLRRRGLPFGRWVLACAVAWALSGVVLAGDNSDCLQRYFSFCWLDVYLAWPVVGAMVAATQWLILRDRGSRAWAWILAGAVGWGLALGLCKAGFLALALENPGGCFLLPAGLAAASPITGAALFFCLRRPPTRLAGGRRALLLMGSLWLLLVVAAVLMLFR